MNLESSSMLSTAARAWAEEVENAEERPSYWTELGRSQGEIEVLRWPRTFYSRIPFQITISVPWGMGREYTTSEANISSVSQYDNYRESGAELKFIFCSMWFIDWLESVTWSLNRFNQENQGYHETAASMLFTKSCSYSEKCFEIYILERNVSFDCTQVTALHSDWAFFPFGENPYVCSQGWWGTMHCLLGIEFVDNFLQIQGFFLLQCFYSSFFQLSAETEQRTPSLNWIMENVLDITVRACAMWQCVGKEWDI